MSSEKNEKLLACKISSAATNPVIIDNSNSPSMQILKRPKSQTDDKINNVPRHSKSDVEVASKGTKNQSLTWEDKQASYNQIREQIFGKDRTETVLEGRKSNGAIDPFTLLSRDFVPKTTVSLKKGDAAAMCDLDNMYESTREDKIQRNNVQYQQHALMQQRIQSMPSFQNPGLFVSNDNNSQIQAHLNQQAHIQQQAATFMDYSRPPPTIPQQQQYNRFCNMMGPFQTPQVYQADMGRVTSLLPTPNGFEQMPQMHLNQHHNQQQQHITQMQTQEGFYGAHGQFYAQQFPPISGLRNDHNHQQQQFAPSQGQIYPMHNAYNINNNNNNRPM